MPEKVFFHAYIQSLIDCWSTLRDSASAHIRRPFSSLHNRAIKIIILLKITTLAISDYNLLSILPLKERLGYNKGVLTHKVIGYNKGVLTHKVLSGKDPPSLMANCSTNQSRHSAKLNIPVPRTDLSKSSLVYSESFLWNSLPDSLRLPSSTEMIKSRCMSYIML